MKYSTHIVTALSVSTALVAFELVRAPDFSSYGFSDSMNWFVFFAVITLSSLIPDIDHSNSYISNKLGFSLPFKHRGFTHYIYLWGFLVFSGITNSIPHSEFALWIGIGGILHSFGDMHTLGGVKLFGFGKSINVLPKFLVFRTGSSVETLFLIGYTSLFIYSFSIIIAK